MGNSHTVLFCLWRGISLNKIYIFIILVAIILIVIVYKVLKSAKKVVIGVIAILVISGATGVSVKSFTNAGKQICTDTLKNIESLDNVINKFKSSSTVKVLDTGVEFKIGSSWYSIDDIERVIKFKDGTLEVVVCGKKFKITDTDIELLIESMIQ